MSPRNGLAKERSERRALLTRERSKLIARSAECRVLPSRLLCSPGDLDSRLIPPLKPSSGSIIACSTTDVKKNVANAPTGREALMPTVVLDPPPAGQEKCGLRGMQKCVDGAESIVFQELRGSSQSSTRTPQKQTGGSNR